MQDVFLLFISKRKPSTFWWHTLLKRLPIFPPAAWMSLTKLSKESLLSDIPAGDGKIANLFYSVSQGDKEGVGCDSIMMYFSVQFFSMKLF